MIGVIDYGIGNVGSIVNMLKKIGAEAKLISTVDEIACMDKLILPGVGSFDAGMKKLREKGLEEAIIQHAKVNKKPLAGICLGMQMLGRCSEEGVESGLNLIPFECKKFNFQERKDLKVPHMGWDIVEMSDVNNPVVRGLEGVQRYYFVHSYYAVCDSSMYELMSCDYGFEFSAAVHFENIYGFQFHPEKSHKFGMALLENFARGV